MIIAGFDPGSSVFGIGIIEYKEDNLSLILSEELKFPNVDFNEKMKILIKHLNNLFSKCKIDEAAIEDGFLGKNVKAMNTLSKVRGVVLAESLRKGIGLSFYSPREIKIAVSGNGNAAKDQVKKMVEILLKQNGKNLGFDESDALATAICHSMIAGRAGKGLVQ